MTRVDVPYSVSVIQEPDISPLTITEARRQCRIEVDSDDLDLQLWIDTATEWLEHNLNGFVLIHTGFRMLLPAFPEVIMLPRRPVWQVDRIEYKDPDNATQLLDPSKYEVSLDRRRPRIWPAYQESWPATLQHQEAVQVEFSAGFDDPLLQDIDGNPDPEGRRAMIPRVAISALRLRVGSLYENRESVMVGGGMAVVDMTEAEKRLVDRLRKGSYT